MVKVKTAQEVTPVDEQDFPLSGRVQPKAEVSHNTKADDRNINEVQHATPAFSEILSVPHK